MSVEFCIVTYNVLSSHLAEPDHFAHCNPADLLPATRLQRLLAKLLPHINNNAVVCLQEVSRDWCGKLHAFFQQHGYTFVTSLYGGSLHGYMGVAVAFPNSHWRLLDADIRKVSETKPWPRDSRQAQQGDWTCPACNAYNFAHRTTCYKCQARKPHLTTFGSSFCCCLAGASRLFRPAQRVHVQQPALDLRHLHSARRRENTLVSVHLQSLASEQQTVWIGCYHMPCAFQEPRVMTMHASLAVQHVQRLALSTQAPCVLAGDWNFKPHGESYRLVTEGRLPRNSSAFPVVPNGDRWRPQLRFAMQSAYQLHHGHEPDFTNFAQVGQEPAFIDTLDYIFISPQLAVSSVPELPHRDLVDGPLPTALEPSDHIPVVAHLKIPESCREAAATEILKGNGTPTGERLRSELSARLQGFSESPEATLCFEPDLTNFERRLVHQLATELGLESSSSGEGAQRCVKVTKAEAPHLREPSRGGHV